MAWDSPEERHQKKIKKTAKGAASALGGGVALWFFSLLYPKHEGVEGLAELLADLSLVLVLYGIAVLCCIIFRNKIALQVNMILAWIIVPAWVAHLLMNAAQ